MSAGVAPPLDCTGTLAGAGDGTGRAAAAAGEAGATTTLVPTDRGARDDPQDGVSDPDSSMAPVQATANPSTNANAGLRVKSEEARTPGSGILCETVRRYGAAHDAASTVVVSGVNSAVHTHTPITLRAW